MSEDNKIIPMAVGRTRAERVAQDLAAAFISEQGCKPSECLIEFGRLPNGKQTVRMRRMSEAEREAARIAQVERDRATLEKLATPMVYVVHPKWWKLSKPVIYLSANGAHQASPTGKVYPIEVRA